MGNASILKFANKLYQILCSWPVKTCLSMFQSLKWLVGSLSKSVGLAACRGCLNVTESMLSWFWITRVILKDSLHLSSKNCQSLLFFLFWFSWKGVLLRSSIRPWTLHPLASISQGMEFQVLSPSRMPAYAWGSVTSVWCEYTYIYIHTHIKTSSLVPIQLGSNIFQPISALLSTILSYLS